jgi:hypothetical protein
MRSPIRRVDQPASLINVGILKYEYYTAVLVVADEKKRGHRLQQIDDEDDRIWTSKAA